MCINLIKLINITGLFPAEKCISYYELSTDLKSLIDEERFKNEMAFLDPSEGVLYGPYGIRKAICSNTGFINALVKIPFIFSIFIFLYKIIAYNRYVILLPKQAALECDCGPDKEKKIQELLFYYSFCFESGSCSNSFKNCRTGRLLVLDKSFDISFAIQPCFGKL